MPRWVYDPVRRHDLSWWRGCWDRGGVPPPEGHQELVRGVGWDKYKYVTIIDRS